MASEFDVSSVPESNDISLSPQDVSRQVIAGDYILKKKKNAKGSRAWEQFWIVFDHSSDNEIFGVACCGVCKVSILYKKKVSGEERSLGTKNMLDHLKRCTPARASTSPSDKSDSASESTCCSSSRSSREVTAEVE